VPITVRCCGCSPTATKTLLACAPKQRAGVHALLCALVPGGLGRELSAAKAAAVLRTIRPAGQVETERKRMASELLADIRRLDTKLRALQTAARSGSGG
jgi:hypothetical protein